MKTYSPSISQSTARILTLIQRLSTSNKPRFLGDSDNSDLLEFTRTRGYRQGDTVRFNPETDEFGALTRDGRFRTYYRPDPKRHGFPTNLDYFNFEKEESSE